MKKSADPVSRNWLAEVGGRMPRRLESVRGQLQGWVRAPTTPQRVAQRSRIVLLALDGSGVHDIASALQVSVTTVRLWLRRFEEGGPGALRHDAPGRGRHSLLSAAVMRERLGRAELLGPDGLPLSLRRAAACLGVSPSAVWRAFRNERPPLRRARR